MPKFFVRGLEHLMYLRQSFEKVHLHFSGKGWSLLVFIKWNNTFISLTSCKWLFQAFYSVAMDRVYPTCTHPKPKLIPSMDSHKENPLEAIAQACRFRQIQDWKSSSYEKNQWTSQCISWTMICTLFDVTFSMLDHETTQADYSELRIYLYWPY